MSFSRAKAALSDSRFSELRWVAETDSTNSDVQSAMTSSEGPAAPREMVVVADHQREGRGRLGRTWEAPSGASLLMTIGTAADIPAARRGLLLAAMSTAAAEAVSDTTGVRLAIKWPNDLVSPGSGSDGGDRKVAGVLAESFALPGGGTGYAVGVGINCNWVSIPDGLGGVAASLDTLSGAPVDREALAAGTVLGFERRLGELVASGAELLEEARARSATIGSDVVVRTPEGEVRGRAVDLDGEGALLVEAGGASPERIVVGDVLKLRPT